MPHKHYDSISAYLKDMGQPPPEHPLFAVVCVSADTTQQITDCPDSEEVITTDFYAISLKKIIEGEFFYGKTRYDCESGTLLFMGPGQEFRTNGIKIKAEGHLILMHSDFFSGHPLANELNNSPFFDYSVNEALHLAPREETLVATVFGNVLKEYESGYDEYSREIIFSYIKTLLGYGERFYRRQFVQRKDAMSSMHQEFIKCLTQHYASDEQIELPTLSDIADNMKRSSRYLSDALKAETGHSAKECMQLFIMNKAKEKLALTDDSVTTIAYDLGFEYPQYFVRLFKKKNHMTPSEFRAKHH